MSTNRSRVPSPALLLAVAAVGTLVPLGEQVAAHKFEAATTTTIRYREATGNFTGRVSSNRDRCIRKRLVKVVKETDEGPVVVGRDRSGREGRWRVNDPNANGPYHAVVKRRFRSDPEGIHIHDCQRGLSPTITINK